MLLFPNATVYVAELTTTKNSEGTKIKTFDFEKPTTVPNDKIIPFFTFKVSIS